MSATEHVCPVCGREYEPEYENREDAPPRSIGREQHQTGICSDECWDKGLGIRADGGRELVKEFEPGEHAVDREATPDRQTPVVVVEHHNTEAREHHVEAADATVYLLNQQYGYPPDATVVDVVYASALDDALAVWRESDLSGDVLRQIVRDHGLTTYSFPSPRLERIEEGSEA